MKDVLYFLMTENLLFNYVNSLNINFWLAESTNCYYFEKKKNRG